MRFEKGHKKVGGFIKGSKHSVESIKKVSNSLLGKFGNESRRWKGDLAGYVAKHMWIAKHYGKASFCENNPLHKSSRFEWANISHKYRRERSDYKQVCRSCHSDMDKKSHCKHGHKYIQKNTFINANGWRECKTCKEARRVKNL